MTALPQQPHLFTIEEHAQLGETENGYTELEEGRLLMSPNPAAKHNFASLRLAMQVDPQLPDDLEVIPDIDIDLELVPPDNIVKRGLCADAGIPYHWIIDVENPISMLVCHQAGQFGYQDSGVMTGVHEVSDPFPLKVDLDKLS